MPVGRLAFAFYVSAFGDSYLVMILANALICATSLYMIFYIVKGEDQTSFLGFILLICPVISLLFSTGYIYDIQWAMQICWFLSVFFGATALIALQLNSYRFIFFALSITLSWLSLSSNIIGVAIFVTAIAIWKSNLKIRDGIFVIAICGCLFFTGFILARYFHPIDPNAYGIPVEFGVILDNWIEIVQLTGVIATTWLLSPLSINSTLSGKGFQNLGEHVYNHQDLNLFVLSIILILIFTWCIQSHNRNNPISLFLLLLGIVVQSGIIVISRFGPLQNLLHVRYAPILQLLATLFWSIAVINCLRHKRRVFASVFVLPISFLVFVTIGCVSMNARKLIEQSSDTGRVSQTSAQLDQFQYCSNPGRVYIFKEIQPSISSQEMCLIVASVSGLID